MLVDFEQSTLSRLRRIFLFSLPSILAMGLYSGLIYCLYRFYPMHFLAIPVTPVSVLSVGLSIFLGFKNSASYDRWWEARKIWGSIVNASRSFGMEVMTILQPNDKVSQEKLQSIQQSFIYRHLSWVNALRISLRRQDDWDTLEPLLSEKDIATLQQAKNKPTQLNLLQGKQLQEAYQLKLIDSIQYMEITKTLKEFYTYQGQCERIKNTPLPRYYAYFTRQFLMVFSLILPFTLLQPFGAAGVLLSILVGSAFWLIENSGRITRNPFENNVTDTPMSSLCRNIEIDLRQQLGETELPAPLKPVDNVLM